MLESSDTVNPPNFQVVVAEVRWILAFDACSQKLGGIEMIEVDGSIDPVGGGRWDSLLSGGRKYGNPICGLGIRQKGAELS